MWTPETWNTEKDIEQDIRVLSEYNMAIGEDLDPSVIKVPDTILQYKKQMEKNKEKPLNSDLDDSASYIVSGRGKGIRDRVIRPGGIIDWHPLDDLQLKKQIRQVSGLGYSNELITQTIKTNGYSHESVSEDSLNFKMISIPPSK